jgi:hypothetical protein
LSLSGSFEGPYIEVLDLDLRVLGKVVVLLCDEHALWKNMLGLCSVNEFCIDPTAEEVLVNLLTVRLWDEPGNCQFE